MKKVNKEVKVSLNSVSVTCGRNNHFGSPINNRYEYEMESTQLLDTETLKCFIEVDEAETLKEFRKLKGINKDELLQWLNKNFKN